MGSADNAEADSDDDVAPVLLMILLRRLINIGRDAVMAYCERKNGAGLNLGFTDRGLSSASCGSA